MSGSIDQFCKIATIGTRKDNSKGFIQRNYVLYDYGAIMQVVYLNIHLQSENA